MNTKTCVGCHHDKPKTAFLYSPNSSAPDKLSIYCAECAVALSEREKTRLITAHWRKNNPQRAEDNRLKSHLLTKYNLNPEEYQRRFTEQNGLCAICGQASKTKNKSGRIYALAVDHEHATGKIRGLLCSGCNQGLGNFGDDIERLRAAIDYLENFRCDQERTENQ